MKYIVFTILILLNVHSHAYASVKQIKPSWSKPFGETDVQKDELDGVSVDPNGNTVISGVFRGEILMDSQLFKSKGEGDIFIASMNAKGDYNWKFTAGSIGDDNTFDLTTDAKGNIYISGWFSNTIEFGKYKLVSRGATDMFVAKLSPEGIFQWVNTYGGKSGDGGNEISVTNNGEIVVSVMSSGDFNIGGKTYKYGGGKRDAYFLRLNSEGKLLYVFPVNGKGTERIRALSIDEKENVYLGFQYRGSLELSKKHELSASGGWDGAMAKISSLGNVEWLYPVASKQTDNVRGIAVDQDGAVYVAGVYGDNAYILDRNAKSYGRKGTDYILKISTSGKPQWIVSAGGKGISMGGEIVLSEQGSPIILGFADGPINFYKNFKEDSFAQIHNNSKDKTVYMAAFDGEGAMTFKYVPEALNGGNSTSGGSISISRDGRYIAQGLRFNESIRVEDNIMTTKSKSDSAIIFFEILSQYNTR